MTNYYGTVSYAKKKDVFKIESSTISSTTSQEDYTTKSGNPPNPYVIITIIIPVSVALAIIIFSIGCYCCKCFKNQKGKRKPGQQNSPDDSEKEDQKLLQINQTKEEALKQHFTEDLILFCSEFCNGSDVVYTNEHDDTESIPIGCALRETFLKKNQKVFLTPNSLSLNEIRLLYYYIICNRIDGKILESFKIIHINLSQEDDLLTVVNRGVGPKYRLTSLDDLKKKRILLLLDGFTADTNDNNIVKDLKNIDMKNFPTLSIWCTENMLPDMVEIEIKLKKVKSSQKVVQQGTVDKDLILL